MTFSDAVFTCFSKYATFSGRASRSEYWWWYLFTCIVGGVASVIDTNTNLFLYLDKETAIGIISLVFSVLLWLPSLAVAVRRYHDSEHSGWWILCPIVNIVLLFFPSKADENMDEEA